MISRYLILFFSIFIFCLSPAYSSDLSFDDMPVQQEGRIKPLDTFAKNQLLRFFGKRSLSYENITSVDLQCRNTINTVHN